MSVKIILVEDHAVVREGLKALLSTENNLEVVAEASNGEEAYQLVQKLRPDLVVMDMNMPVMSGLECTRILKKEFPEIRILILSMYDHESYLVDLLDAGADGYVLKNSKKEELLFAINKVANDGMYIGPEFTMNLLTKKRLEKSIAAQEQEQKLRVDISDREMEVLELIAQGMTNAEMANRLFISVRTIETRRKKLLEKTGTTNTATLIKFSIQNGLIK